MSTPKLPPVPLPTDTIDTQRAKAVARLTEQLNRATKTADQARALYGPHDDRYITAIRRQARVARRLQLARNLDLWPEQFSGALELAGRNCK